MPASSRIRSTSVSEVRRAITARSTDGSPARNAAIMPAHITPQRSEPNTSQNSAWARSTGAPPAAS